ncbi:hypothetical protein MMC16_001433 [Acarospora aff. strigata]|nr:hypothetical protein [Acarospora aff. strigata]
MADETPAADEAPITFNIKSSSDAKYVLTLPTSTTVLELKTKLSGSDYADLPTERQRLIYSGRVLKDHDTLGSYKIKDGHTVHLVKGAASNVRQNPANQGSSTTSGTGTSATPAAAGVPTNIAAGTGNNPLAGLTGARYAGFAQLPGAGMFGPDGGMGPPPDPEQMITMLENPQFQSTINEALQNPQILDMMIQQNPMLRNMPGVRQIIQSPEFLRMMTDPAAIRSITQMQRAMGTGPFGGAGGGENAFPAPGVTDTTPTNSQTPNQTNTTGTPQPPNPFATIFGNPTAAAAAGAGANANPFAALFNPTATATASPPPAAQGTPAAGQPGPQNTSQDPTNPQNMLALLAGLNPAFAGTAAPGTTANATQPQQPPAAPQNQNQNQNPFANLATNPLFQNPQLMQQMLQAMNPGGNGAVGGGGADAAAAMNPFLSMFGPGGLDGAALQGQGQGPGQGFGAQAQAQDPRPPEERYEEQLRQLNEMGFHEFERNVEALRRSGGVVQFAVEWLLNH